MAYKNNMPKRTAVKWTDSLQFKINLGFIILFLVMVGSIAGVIQTVAKSFFREDNYHLIENAGNKIVADLGNIIFTTETLSNALANLGKTLEPNETTYKQIIPTIIDHENQKSLIAGGGIWPEPYKFTPDKERRSFFWGRELDGTLKYYDDYNNPTGPGYHQEEWYVTGKYVLDGTCFWSKSYMDPYSLQPMVTCTSPIKNKDDLLGVTTIDLKLEGLHEFFNTASKLTGGYAFAVDRNNKFLSFPNEAIAKSSISNETDSLQDFIYVDQLANKDPLFAPIADVLTEINQEIIKISTQNPQFNSQLAQQITQDSYQIDNQEAELITAILLDSLKTKTQNSNLLKQFTLSDDLLLHEPATVFVFHMPKTYWKIVIVTPTSEVTATANTVTKTVLTYLVGIMVAFLFTAFLLIKQNIMKPIKNMAEPLKSIAQGTSDLRLRLDDSARNEFGELAYWFNRRTDELRIVNEKLRAEIAERERTRSELEESEERLRLSLEAFPNPTIFYDPTGLATYVNPAFTQTFGWTREELIGKKIEFVPEENWPETIDGIKRVYGKEKILEFESRRYTKNGQILDVELTAARFDDNKGKPAGLIVVIRDITERKQAAEALREAKDELELRVKERTAELLEAKTIAETANKAKSEFLANMSHELRTPLNGILGYAQILKRDENLNAHHKNGLNIIHQSGEHLLTLINDILDLAKIEASRLDIHPTDIYLPTFLQNIADICSMRAKQKNISFIYQTTPPLPTGVKVDETRLRQVLLNLLGNALKFTDQGKVIFKVNTLNISDNYNQTQNWKIRFEIEDTGPGMTPEQLNKIFLPFEQVGEVKRQKEGTGLGLAISQKLVELMGGTIQVKSTINQGSTFWLELEFPVVTVITDYQQTKQQIITGYTGPTYKILVVDDKEHNRSVFVNLLKPLGFELFEAEDGQQGVENAQQIKPDLILMDLIMPVMMGLEATEKIRKIPALQDIPIIATSASVFDEDRHRSILAGCNDFLAKPVQAEKLYSYLETYLNLEWLYREEADQEISQTNLSRDGINPIPNQTQNSYDDSQLIAPPPEEIAILFELAMIGNMRKLQNQADYIEKLDPKFIPFATKLRQLAKGFQDKQILELVEQFMKDSE